MNPHHWIEVTPSEYPWEREALAYLKERLPDGDPFRAWSNFEFIAHNGSINEVDLLVVSLHSVFLVEIKSWQGVVAGDQGTWRRTVNHREFLTDNPLLLANRKARKLAALLKEQSALARERMPYIEPVVFLSRARCRLEGLARTGVYLPTASPGGGPSIIDMLSGHAGFDATRPRPRIDRPLARAVARAMEQAGIRQSQRRRRAADYVLRDLLLEAEAWQDWEAEHVSVPSSKRRIRVFPLARASSESARAAQTSAAKREFRLLDGIEHDGILRVQSFTETEQGPAIVFEHDPSAERLDHFLARRGDELPLDTRLHMLRQLAETLQYAHERRLYHRGLGPQRVLVLEPDSSRPRLKIFDWQTGKHLAGTSDPAPSSVSVPPLSATADDADAVYLAPETALGGLDACRLDLFSLGAIGYRLFTGEPPAATVEALHARLVSGGGLRLSDQMDGAPEALHLIIECATDPEVTSRPDSVAQFLEQLDETERELASAREPEEGTVHPLDAGAEDLLEHGFLVVRRLGRGATAVVLQVDHDEKSGVLKVALDPSHNERIRQEGALLRTLRHPHIVEAYRDLELAGHAAIFMAMAGADNKNRADTLADRIRAEGRLSLDLLQRFGDQLLSVVQWLEEQGISHRDIKPDNIGVSGTPLGVVVFDFSLANTPADDIRAGTPQYRDPFLPLRKAPRWDSYAERFAAAMTLHEMATGQLPTWGDGQSDPALIDKEVSVDAELFDPAIREALTGFFSIALARDFHDRFDNGEEMRRAWFRCFEAIDVAADHDEGNDAARALDDVTEATTLAALGLSPRMLNALERIGAHTVGELITLPRIRLFRNTGIGHRVVKRIRSLADRLAAHLADTGRPVEVARSARETEQSIDPAQWSIDLLADRMTPASSGARTSEDVDLIRWALGLDGDFCSLLAQQALIDRQGASSPAVAQAMRRARERWRRQGWLKPLRDSVAALVTRHGGVMTAAELANALAAARGSTAEGEVRSRRAAAATAAALDGESQLITDCRYRVHGDNEMTLVLATAALDAACTATDEARAAFVRQLAQAADRLADADPLASPARVQAVLDEIEPPSGMQPLGADRRLRLAVQASERAALSSRGELYPRGMPAARAIKLGASSLLGPKALAEAQIRRRLASRYPEAIALPGRPALDRLLEDAGLGLVWDQDGGAYRAQTPYPTLTSSSTSPDDAVDAAEEAADTLEDRIRRSISANGFLALAVPARAFLAVERYLADRFALRLHDVEAELIGRMKELAHGFGADWNVVLGADAMPPGSPGQRRLHRLVHRAAADVLQAIATIQTPLLLTRCGLLARYRRVDLLATLQDDCQRGAAPAARVLCIARQSGAQMPAIDGQPLPVVVASAWAQPGAGWLARAEASACGSNGAAP